MDNLDYTIGMLNTPKEIILHETDVSYTKNADQFEAVNTYHKNEGFLRSSLGYFVGYHSLITGDKNYKCKEEWEEGCHTNQLYTDGVSMNLRSLGVCVGFDGDIEMMTTKQYALLQQQIWAWQEKYAIPNSGVKFHRYYNKAKTCPGSLLMQPWLDKLLERASVIQVPAVPGIKKPVGQCEKQEAIIATQTRALNLWQMLWNYVQFKI